MKAKNQVGDTENMFKYRFIRINNLYEEVEIFEIIAGCESDAFDLVDEENDNFSSCMLLTDNMLKKLKQEIKKNGLL